jgi:cytochrome bd-type quinol oxidase subunit 1
VPLMGEAVNVHRLHFAFTITFHYIFPQLTMGLAGYSTYVYRSFAGKVVVDKDSHGYGD